MTLDLREVIGVPSLSVSFDYAPDLADYLGDQYLAFVSPPRAVGTVRNNAGALSMTAHVDAEITTVCSRCLCEFTFVIDRDIAAKFGEGASDDDSELYFIENARLDVDDLLLTELLLDQTHSPVCRDDCRGLCADCGADLNLGDCGCGKEIDPRLAALAQLLDDTD
ncbi:MAG: DUF177 domain-containing protein [Oscillospiraceae bacterium]|jgi:uncharacterized protein|nr:DUF177 domain-containing protein [Oscillospiraceae bacterium]